MVTKRLLTVLALSLLVCLGGMQPATARRGRGTPVSNPFNLSQLQGAGIPGRVQFLGSFLIPHNNTTGFSQSTGSIFVNGNTMYLSGSMYDPWDTSKYAEAAGVGMITMPTLSGTPAYDGSNGTATVPATCSYNINNGLCVPWIPGSYTAPANYTWTSAPVTGATSATFTSLPPGLTANAGWYVGFNGTTTVDRLITGVSGNTVSWGAALPTNTYTTANVVHQWNPTAACGNAQGWRIGGTLIANGNLYLTCGTYYDSGSNQTGWIAETSPSTPGSGWGVMNTVAGQPTEFSRFMMGALGNVPPIWQPFFGPAYETGGHALSVISNNTPMGPTFQEFNPTNVLMTANAVPITTGLAYYYQGVPTSAYPEQLSGRSFTGPFPQTTTTGYYPATLTAAPSQGATSVTLVLPTGTVTATGNTTSGQNAIALTAVTGTISNSGIVYNVTDTGGAIPNSDNYFQPSYDYAPGTALGAGDTFNLGASATKTLTGDSLTLVPAGYNTGYWQICFSDGECRTVHLQGGNTDTPEATVPFPLAGSSDPSTFAPLTGCTIAAPCTAAVTMAPLGDNYVTPYDNPYGYGFFWPNTSTFATLTAHLNGPHRGRDAYNICFTGASSSNSIPLKPDTAPTISLEFNLFNASDLYSIAHGSPAPYALNPYATVAFPGASNLFESNGCLVNESGATGWVFFDPTTNILYVAPTGSYGSQAAGGVVVYEYQISDAANDPKFNILKTDQQLALAA